MATEHEARAVEEVLRSWLADPDVILYCGDWAQGGVMELLPRGGASLSGPRYDPPFHGLRELRVAGGGHHVHLDLGRLTRIWYVIAPSVCYGFRPSFELRLTTDGAKPLIAFGLGVAIGSPYRGRRLRTDAVVRYLRRAGEHIERFPGAVSLLCDRSDTRQSTQSIWDEVESLMQIHTHGSDAPLRPLHRALHWVGEAVPGPERATP